MTTTQNRMHQCLENAAIGLRRKMLIPHQLSLSMMKSLDVSTPRTALSTGLSLTTVIGPSQPTNDLQEVKGNRGIPTWTSLIKSFQHTRRTLGTGSTTTAEMTWISLTWIGCLTITTSRWRSRLASVTVLSMTSSKDLPTPMTTWITTKKRDDGISTTISISSSSRTSTRVSMTRIGRKDAAQRGSTTGEKTGETAAIPTTQTTT